MERRLTLKAALRAHSKTCMALVGAGGKTTAMFVMAREYKSTVLVSTSTHLSLEQTKLADHHITSNKYHPFLNQINGLDGVILVTGDADMHGKVSGPGEETLDQLRKWAEEQKIPFLVESDGSRCKPLKAPGAHEPAIPPWVDHVVVVCGLSALGKPLDDKFVHRADIFGRLGGIGIGDLIAPDPIVRVLTDAAGGMKNIPKGAHTSVLLNQADTPQLQSIAGTIAQGIEPYFQEAVTCSLVDPIEPIKAVHSLTAGIILAAGKSSRMGGQSKVFLDWLGEPFIRKIAQTALQAGLKPIRVVTGDLHNSISTALADLPVEVIYNPDWETGQSSSLQTGLKNLPRECGSALFLLGDQPQVTPSVIDGLVEIHAHTLAPIVAPLVDGRRATPVLFDRNTFQQLNQLTGDMGGRGIFQFFQVTWLPWNDPLLLRDVDTPQDYLELLEAYGSSAIH